ncbi:MAG TPA: DUF4157 domain-containing protein [Thermoanaerobaculia bacterium]|nr:DUF4157 domain-containing protein [Thermoanaerobaculia bacterium]
MGLLQRKCACGQHTGGGECEDCRKKSQKESASGGLPAIVGEALFSSGQPLGAGVRAFMEPRIGHDFSQVRVHTGDVASRSAAAVDALAYTVGSDVVFRNGLYAPEMAEGRKLLAHELTHVVQQGKGLTPSSGLNVAPPSSPAEREAESVAGTVQNGARSSPFIPIGSYPLQLARQQSSQAAAPAQTAPAASSSEMTRSEFEGIMRRRYLVADIHTGTFEEQRVSLPRQGTPAGSGLTQSVWQSWDPGDASPVYSRIIRAFEEFENRIGGVPPVEQIVFYDMDYEITPAGAAVPRPDTGASFGAGHLTVYRAATTSRKPLPISRSNARGTYPSVVAGVVGVPGQTPGAPLPVPTPEQDVTRIVEHEMGHGLAEAAMRENPATFNEYRRAVGWTPGLNPELYDVGVPAVRTALDNGTPPPATHRITEGDWNHPRWIEQPLSDYMVAGGPGEDFAEAVMVYVNNPGLLRSRSPERYRFLDRRRESWLPQLLRRPPVGDFPVPRGDQQLA